MCQLPLLNQSEREIVQGTFYVVKECCFIALRQVRYRRSLKQDAFIADAAEIFITEMFISFQEAMRCPLADRYQILV